MLTQASVLTITAMPNRTSPVKRGKYILEQILGTPPPPPPADVPALPDKRKDAEVASVRKRLEQHRADPTCASCHVRMDAIGFSLENFDAIGGWRDRDGKFDVDSTGTLPEGEVLQGVDGLKANLMSRKSEVVGCVVEKLLTYGLGRGMEFDDTCTIKDVTTDAAKSDYRFSALVLGVVKSDAFQKRRPYEEPQAIKDKRAADLKAAPAKAPEKAAGAGK